MLAMLRRRGPAASGLVFATSGGGAFANWDRLVKALRAAGAPADVRLHDLRRAAVSACADAGCDFAALDSWLNHAGAASRPGVIGIYQRASLLGPMRRAVATWVRLLGLAEGEVVPLAGRAA
jgi:integrase